MICFYNELKMKKMNLLPFGRDFKPDKQIILRDYLANERTLLSYYSFVFVNYWFENLLYDLILVK